MLSQCLSVVEVISFLEKLNSLKEKENDLPVFSLWILGANAYIKYLGIKEIKIDQEAASFSLIFTNKKEVISLNVIQAVKLYHKS